LCHPFTEISPARELDMTRGLNVLALVKDSERYVFLYDDHSPDALLQTLGKFAADPDLSFTWYDAAILSQRIRRQRQTRATTEISSSISTSRLGDLHG